MLCKCDVASVGGGTVTPGATAEDDGIGEYVVVGDVGKTEASVGDKEPLLTFSLTDEIVPVGWPSIAKFVVDIEGKITTGEEIGTPPLFVEEGSALDSVPS